METTELIRLLAGALAGFAVSLLAEVSPTFQRLDSRAKTVTITVLTLGIGALLTPIVEVLQMNVENWEQVVMVLTTVLIPMLASQTTLNMVIKPFYALRNRFSPQHYQLDGDYPSQREIAIVATEEAYNAVRVTSHDGANARQDIDLLNSAWLETQRAREAINAARAHLTDAN